MKSELSIFSRVYKYREREGKNAKEKDITEFMSEKEDHIIAMKKFLKEAINEIAKIKQKHPKISTK